MMNPESKAERSLFEAIKTGKQAEYECDHSAKTDAEWASDDTIRGEFLEKLCQLSQIKSDNLLGIYVSNVFISGNFTINHLIIDVPVSFINVRFENTPNLGGAKFKYLQFRHCYMPGILANGIHTNGTLDLRESQFLGSIEIAHSNIKGCLLISNICVKTVSPYSSLIIEETRIEGTFDARKSSFLGKIEMQGATIGGNLKFNHATINASHKNVSIDANGTLIGGSVFFSDNCNINGEVRLNSSKVNRNIDFTESNIRSNNICISAQGITIGQNCRILKAKLSGIIRFNSASINNDFIIKRTNITELESKYNNSEIDFSNSRVGGDLHVLNCSLSDSLSMKHVNVSGDLIMRSLEISDKYVMSLEGSEIKGRLAILGCRSGTAREINFSHVLAGQFDDDKTAWPIKNGLFIDGFEYKALGSRISLESRLEWFERMPEENFHPQPYEQLSKVYKREGHERFAKKTLIEKQKRLRVFLARRARIKLRGVYLDNEFQGGRRLSLFIAEKVVGYGYEPWRATLGLLIVFAFGWVVFFGMHDNGLIEPAKEVVYTHPCYIASDKDENSVCEHWSSDNIKHGGEDGTQRFIPPDYPEFNSFVYSLDVLLPIVDLKLEDHWMPSSRGFVGMMGRLYFWLHIALGWVFTTIAVVAFTGLIKQDQN